MIRLLIILVFMLLASNCVGQKRFTYPKYGFGAGTQIGWGSLQPELNANLILGLNGSYQRNYIEWFSLRFELGYEHYFQVPKSSFSSFFFGDIEPVLVEEESEINFSSNQLYLSLSPLLYLRDGRANYYIGFSAGIGGTVVKWNGRIETRITNSPDQIQFPTGSDTFGIFGLSPVVGFAYSLGRKSRSSSELDFQVTYKNWFNNARSSPVEPNTFLSINAVILQFTYRILLEN